MIEVVPFRPEFTHAVTDLIVGIQRNEFGIDITAEQQPDLQQISDFYQVGRGNFWVAMEDDRVVGTISLLDIGNRLGALRKMFVAPTHRGAAKRTAARLLEELLDWCVEQPVEEVFLGTTSAFLAAHRFYEKNGFEELPVSHLPAAFPIMAVDTKFYHLEIQRR